MMKFVWTVLIVTHSLYATYAVNKQQINTFPKSQESYITIAGVDQPLELADSLSGKTNELVPDSAKQLDTTKKLSQESLNPCDTDPIDHTAVDFNLTPQVLDFKHRELTCSAPFYLDLTYSWDMGDGTTLTGANIQHNYAIINGNAEITVKLTVTNAGDCSISGSKTVKLISFIPNIFTPNGDGINDVFMKGNLITILDRSGTILYHGINGWDGTYNGKIVNRDTYFYLIELIDKDLKMHTHKGYITLEK